MRGPAALAIAAALTQGGCYNYRSVRRSELAPATHVVVMLTEDGSAQLTNYLGPTVRVVRGVFMSATERGLLMSVASVENERGDVLQWKGETVMVPGEFVRSIDERRMAPSKTVLLAGAGVAGFFAAYAAFGSGGSGTAAQGGGGGQGAH